MTEVILQPMQCCPVEIGGVRLYLSKWKMTGVRVLREQCHSGNAAAVTASYPKGTRLTMEGKLAPRQGAASVTAALAKRLSEGTKEDVQVQGLTFPAAVLCAYTLTQDGSAVEVMLQFYTEQVPMMTEGEAYE